jgi:AcrR family transcriptional regulator
MARRPTRPARKSSRPSAGARPSASSAKPSAPTGEREKIIAALFALLADEPIERIGLAEIANEAGVSLVQLRGAFASPLAIVAAH